MKLKSRKAWAVVNKYESICPDADSNWESDLAIYELKGEAEANVLEPGERVIPVLIVPEAYNEKI